MRCEPVFRGVVRECEVAFGEFVDWSLVGVLEGDEVAGIDVVQPVLFAVEVGLAALWRSWGVQPAAVVGHSMGEVAAAYVAGALSLSDAARVICSRSGLLRQVAGRGAMAVVELDAVAVGEVVAGFGGEVVMAAWNGPMTSVVAGSPQAVDAVVELLSGREVFARRVQVDVASHSPQVDGLRVDLLERLGQVAPRVGSVPLYSTVRGEVLAGDELDAGYWWENLREPVRFAPAVDRLLADGLTCFLEISPHPVLSSAVEQSCRRGGAGVVLPSTRRDSPERLSMLETAGTLYQLGVPIQWRALYPSPGEVVRLPSYPWQRERFWPESVHHSRPTQGHPLLGGHVESSLGQAAHLWTAEVGTDLSPYLADHKVRGQVIMPAAAYVEMALSAAAEIAGAQAQVIEDLTFASPLALADERPITIQTTITGNPSDALHVRCASRQPDEQGGQAGWLTHAHGTIRMGAELELPPLPDSFELPGAGPAGTADDHYEAMHSRGLDSGQPLPQHPAATADRRAGVGAYPAHRRTRKDLSWRTRHCWTAACRWPWPRAAGPADTYVPVGIERLALRDRLSGPLTCHAQIRPGGAGDERIADLLVCAEGGRPLMAITGLRLRRMKARALAADLLYEVRWEPLAAAAGQPAGQGRWLLLADRDTTLDSALAARGHGHVVVRAGGAYRRIDENDVYELDPTRPEHFRDLLAEAFGPQRPCRGVIHRWASWTPARTPWSPPTGWPPTACCTWCRRCRRRRRPAGRRACPGDPRQPSGAPRRSSHRPVAGPAVGSGPHDRPRAPRPALHPDRPRPGSGRRGPGAAQRVDRAGCGTGVGPARPQIWFPAWSPGHRRARHGGRGTGRRSGVPAGNRPSRAHWTGSGSGFSRHVRPAPARC